MQIAVIGDGEKQKTFQDKEIPEGVFVQFYTTITEAKKDADGYFYLLGKENLYKDMGVIKELESPVFVVENQPEELPAHVAMIHGWPQFLFEPVVKVTFNDAKKDAVRKILNIMKWDFEPEAL